MLNKRISQSYIAFIVVLKNIFSFLSTLNTWIIGFNENIKKKKNLWVEVRNLILWNNIMNWPNVLFQKSSFKETDGSSFNAINMNLGMRVYYLLVD